MEVNPGEDGVVGVEIAQTSNVTCKCLAVMIFRLEKDKESEVPQDG